jgi:uncharacterized membrane protein YbhN (UPF0104 family)
MTLGDAIERIGEKRAYLVSPLKVTRWLIQIGIGLALLWGIVQWSKIDFEQLWLALRGASFLNLTLAIIFFVISIHLKTIQFQRCIGINDLKTSLFGLFLVQNALVTILPWRIGEVGLPLLLLRSQNIPLTKSVSGIVIIRVVDLIIIALVAAIGSTSLGIDVSRKTLAILLIILIMVFSAARLIFQRFLSFKIARAMSAIVACIPNSTTLGKVSLVSVAVFGASVLQSAFALRAFGLTIPLPEIAILNAVTLLVAVLPLHPPGGWGTIDFIQLLVLQRLNIQAQIATPAILVTHGFYTVLVLLGGAFGWLLCRTLSRQ